MNDGYLFSWQSVAMLDTSGGAPSWLRTRSVAAVREVLSLPLPYFRAFVHCSYKCFKKSFKVVFFHNFVENSYIILFAP